MKIDIPEFKSVDEFCKWWESDSIRQLRQTNPDELNQLLESPKVKPWSDQVMGKTITTAPTTPPIQPFSSSFTERMGETLGKYKIIQELGKGGMGVVYLAHDPTLDRRVALKVMTAESGVNEEQVTRFKREAHALAQLKHPNIVEVYDIGTVGDQHYFTMDYIEGTTLEKLIEKRVEQAGSGLPGLWLAGIFREISLALEAAHQKNIIHRDVKPANIFIDLKGKAFLADFGLAKETTGLDRSLTISGAVMGTPYYMSPEQARGKKRQIGRTSDIFSLGATLYHALTGRMPFRGDQLYDVLTQVVHGDTIPPRTIVPDIPQELETICLKCLEKNKSARYQTAQGLADDLFRFLNNQPIVARSKAKFGKSGSKARRSWVMIPATFGFLITITVAGWLLYKWWEENKPLISSIIQTTPTRNTTPTITPTEPVDQSDKAWTCFKKGEKLFKQGQINRAIIQYSLAIESRPDFVEAYINRGLAYIKKNRFELAIADLNIALELKPDSAEAYLNRGLAYTKRQKWTRAINDYSQAIRLNPQEPLVYYNRSWAYWKDEQFQSALEDGKKFLQLAPDHPQAARFRETLKRWKWQLEEGKK